MQWFVNARSLTVVAARTLQEWDYTNFLVDLSGHHAHCKATRHQAGVKEIHRRTPAGETIVAAVDFTDGSLKNTHAIDGYIQEVIKRWETTNQFYAQVDLWGESFYRATLFLLLFLLLFITP